jgi:Ca-activated chloride channel family protein
MTRVRRAWCGLLAGLTLGVALAADPAHELVAKGNGDYAAGRYAEALAAYEQAASQTRPSPELLHDMAAANFKLGKLDAARDLWVRLKDTGDAAFAARTRYNLGNCDYADALAAAQQNPQAALQHLAVAAEQYRAALRLDPQFADARANLELTQLLKQQIEEQSQQQPQSQPSGDQSQEQQDQQQQSPPSQPSSQPQSQPSRQQQEQSAQSQPAESQPAPQPESQPGDEPDDEQPEGEPPPPTTQPEMPPPETQPAGEQQQAGEASPIQMSREQAERLLQMIRDAEKARREKLAQQQMAKQKPVDRDW